MAVYEGEVTIALRVYASDNGDAEGRMKRVSERAISALLESSDVVSAEFGFASSYGPQEEDDDEDV